MSRRLLKKHSGRRSAQGTFTQQSPESSPADDVRQDQSQAHNLGSSSNMPPLREHSSREKWDDKRRHYGKNVFKIRLSNRNNESVSSRFGFTQLMGLSQRNGSDTAREILHNSKFKLLLDSRMNDDYLVLTLHILAKLEYPEPVGIDLKISILSHISESRFLETLERYLAQLPRKTGGKLYAKNVSSFWNDLHNFFKIIIDITPEQTYVKLMLILELTKGYVIGHLKTRSNHELLCDLEPCFEQLYNRLKEKKENIAILQQFQNLGVIPKEKKTSPQDARTPTGTKNTKLDSLCVPMFEHNSGSGKREQMVEDINLQYARKYDCQQPSKPALCQHPYSLPNGKIKAGVAEYADEFLKDCTTPCATLLPCGHTCNGTCGTCKQGRIHQACLERCNRILICGHRCEAHCGEICKPCQKICYLKCEHKQCLENCTDSCIPCQAPCSRQCIHFKCEKLCRELCDVESCDEPCPVKLKCGHPCIGFCGEPCPPLCRICDEKDLPHFITEKNEPYPRFVYLQECGHSVEKNYLDWAWKGNFRIGIPVCPISNCHARITYCKRYSNLIKRERKNMGMIEAKVCRRLQFLRTDQQRMLEDISSIEYEYSLEFPDIKAHKTFFRGLHRLIREQGYINIILLQDISTKLTITKMILEKLQEILPIDRQIDDWPLVLNQIILLMESLPTHQNVSYQMIEDVGNEIRRLHHMIQLCKLKRDVGFDKEANALQIEIIYSGLLNLQRFTTSRSETIYKQISELKNSLKSSVVVNEPQHVNLRMIGLAREDWRMCSRGHFFVINCRNCLSPPPSAPIEEIQE